jgi:hypothetical protein
LQSPFRGIKPESAELVDVTRRSLHRSFQDKSGTLKGARELSKPYRKIRYATAGIPPGDHTKKESLLRCERGNDLFKAPIATQWIPKGQ